MDFKWAIGEMNDGRRVRIKRWPADHHAYGIINFAGTPEERYNYRYRYPDGQEEGLFLMPGFVDTDDWEPYPQEEEHDWEWALEQIKEGKTVKRPHPNADSGYRKLAGGNFIMPTDLLSKQWTLSKE